MVSFPPSPKEICVHHDATAVESNRSSYVSYASLRYVELPKEIEENMQQNERFLYYSFSFLNLCQQLRDDLIRRKIKIL